MRKTTEDTSSEVDFPIVAVGASAGGLEPLRKIFSCLPDDTGMAFVVIQHLDPGRPSMLTKVLATEVGMAVVEVTDGMRVEPNHVYVIPSHADLDLHQGVLTLVQRQAHKLHLPIDSFFRALAADSSKGAIGVVLSGSASDGSAGLSAIKAAGGITLAQEPTSAQFKSMPESAIATGHIDIQATPGEIANELIRLSRHSYLGSSPSSLDDAEHGSDDDACIATALAAIRRHTQLDFRGYKQPTIARRVARRMALREYGSLREYVDSLRVDHREGQVLAQDILIHVTSFFRDPAAFDAVERLVLPELASHKDEDSSFRVWVAGCSTGQEVYSLAIVLVEFLAKQRRELVVKIFGSDLSKAAIDAARVGLYTQAELEGVSPERLDRFFDEEGGRYRVSKRIRDLCVFVRHDLNSDPPFAKLDLISCRNVLIYFGAELQRRILPLFHHCLNKPGYLLLGSSEGVREDDDLFAPIDKDHRIFLKTGEGSTIAYPLMLGRETEPSPPARQVPRRPRPAREAQRQAEHILLARYAPPGVVINEALEVVQFRGRTGDFFEPPPGLPQMNVLKMARKGLDSHLREAIETAKTESATVRMQGLQIAGGDQVINLEVVPLGGDTATTERYFLIVFEDAGGHESHSHGLIRSHPDDEVTWLRAQLAAAQDGLYVTTGEHQDTAAELGTANEKLQSANEELQSANEELQSAKEELQSMNEELTTLIDELHNRNHELDEIASDLVNVLESVQIPVIILDRALRVRRFTPTTRQVSSLRSGDVGRSIDDVKFKIKIDDLAGKISATITSLAPKQYEVKGDDGRWLRLHIRPYRTPDNQLDGAVLSFLDIDLLKRAVVEAEHARDYAQSVFETIPLSLVVIDHGMDIVSANPPFCRSVGALPSTIEQRELFQIGDGAFAVPSLREAIERSAETHASFRDLAIQCTFPGLGQRDLIVNGCPILASSGDQRLLLVIDDVTERRLLEASAKQLRVDAVRANQAKDFFLATLSHELRTPLNTIMMSAQLLRLVISDDPRIGRASMAIDRAVGQQSRLIDDLLDISRIVSGKLVLELQAVSFAAVVQSAVDVALLAATTKELELELTVHGSLRWVYGDADRLQQVVANLLNNAIKFTPPGGKITVDLEAIDDDARLVVSDTGVGFDAELIPFLFNRFVQAEASMTRSHGGLGLGLAIVRHIVTAHGGATHARSPGKDKGAIFTITLPLTTHQHVDTPMKSAAGSRVIDGVRVLLIDDDPDAREACAMLLAEQGAEVRIASSAASARAAFDGFAPQVILCDIAMPGEDGYSFIRALRSDGRPGHTVPAAALTALASDEDRQRALASGFQMQLAKPIDAERLATAVAALANWPEPLGYPPEGLRPG